MNLDLTAYTGNFNGMKFMLFAAKIVSEHDGILNTRYSICVCVAGKPIREASGFADLHTCQCTLDYIAVCKGLRCIGANAVLPSYKVDSETGVLHNEPI